MEDRIELQQHVTRGNGNVQIGKLVFLQPPCECACSAPHWHEDGDVTILQREELSRIAVQIERAEGGLVEGAAIWAALCQHLSGRKLDAINDRTTNISEGQYWEARTYLCGWLACARRENLPAPAIIREIMRMWAIRTGLQQVTLEFCRAHCATESLRALSDAELRAALWVTVAAWERYWGERQVGQL